MSKEDWYRNTEWNEQIEIEFEARLKRSRGNYNKAQYLRIQASYLLQSNEEELQKIGEILMIRVINDYPEEYSSTIFGNEQLGDYYFELEKYDKAEKHFRIVTQYYHSKTRSNTSGLADLKLCEVILKTEQVDKFNEAYELATKRFNETDGNLIMNSSKFYYSQLMANLCYKMNKKQEASSYAKLALELSDITEPQFNRHKNVGLVKATGEQIEELKRIRNN